MQREDVSVGKRRRIYNIVRQSIIGVQGPSNNLGGGVFVKVGSQQLVLTAAHVVLDSAYNFKIFCADGISFQARRVHFERKTDLALLEVSNKPEGGFKCLELYDGPLSSFAEIHFVGHPGRQNFTYNIGRIACVTRTCEDIYRELMMSNTPEFPKVDSPKFIDDFRGLASNLKLVSGKNVHGGGRFGGTGAPFLDGKGRIVGLYSFTLREEDYAIHVAEIQQMLDTFKAQTSC